MKGIFKCFDNIYFALHMIQMYKELLFLPSNT